MIFTLLTFAATQNYHLWENWVIRCVTLILLAVTVMFVVTNSSFKKVNTGEERVSLIDENVASA